MQGRHQYNKCFAWVVKLVDRIKHAKGSIIAQTLQLNLNMFIRLLFCHVNSLRLWIRKMQPTSRIIYVMLLVRNECFSPVAQTFCNEGCGQSHKHFAMTDVISGERARWWKRINKKEKKWEWFEKHIILMNTLTHSEEGEERTKRRCRHRQSQRPQRLCLTDR